LGYGKTRWSDVDSFVWSVRWWCRLYDAECLEHDQLVTHTQRTSNRPSLEPESTVSVTQLREPWSRTSCIIATPTPPPHPITYARLQELNTTLILLPNQLSRSPPLHALRHVERLQCPPSPQTQDSNLFLPPLFLKDPAHQHQRQAVGLREGLGSS
jgi:hypothetical protein